MFITLRKKNRLRHLHERPVAGLVVFQYLNCLYEIEEGITDNAIGRQR